VTRPEHYFRCDFPLGIRWQSLFVFAGLAVPARFVNASHVQRHWGQEDGSSSESESAGFHPPIWFHFTGWLGFAYCVVIPPFIPLGKKPPDDRPPA
jgi:hypothetical protein